METVKLFILSFLATIGFSVLFHTPKDMLIKSGAVGAISWIVYYATNQVLENNIVSTLLGSITIGILGELFSRYYKKPATVFIIPGIIPLVPGAGTYYTMLAFVVKDYSSAASNGIETLLIAGSISAGLLFTSMLSTSIRRVKNKG